MDIDLEKMFGHVEGQSMKNKKLYTIISFTPNYINNRRVLFGSMIIRSIKLITIFIILALALTSITTNMQFSNELEKDEAATNVDHSANVLTISASSNGRSTVNRGQIHNSNVENDHRGPDRSMVYFENGDQKEPNGEEIVMPSNEDSKIHLRYAAFDPITSQPEIPAWMDAQEDSRLTLVQLVGPTNPDWYRTLEAVGLSVLRYIPDFTYLVHENRAGALTESEKLDFVRWVGPYHPVYKIDPELTTKAAQSLEKPAAYLEVEVKLFPELVSHKEHDTIIALIENLEGRVLDAGYVNRIITAQLIASTIFELAKLDPVEWLGLHSDLKATMDNIRIFTGTDYMHDLNVSGQPIVGEIKDNGIDQDHPEFEGQLIGTDGNVDEQNHGTSTFGIVFAKGVDERALGQSNGSGGIFCQWDVGRYQSIRNLVNNWDGLFQSNSWSQGAYDGEYNQYSEENDRAVFDFDISMLYAAGNGGDDGAVTKDGTAKNVITVGGLDHYDNTDRGDDRHTGSQGNKGPTQDGRIKPDLSGPYDNIYTTTGGGGYTSGFGGTSGATPVTAGALSLAYQLYMANHFGNNPAGTVPHASTIKALAIANAYQHDLLRADRFAQGWGYIDMDYIYNMSVNHLIVDEEIALETDESFSVNFQPTTLTPLKVSLVWTDVPGTTSSSRHLINDLDLRLTSPSGNIYWGNYDLENNLYSETGGERDSLNNVENVFVEEPEEGIWKMEVLADNIPMDGDPDTSELDQPFSVVVSGVIREEHELVLGRLETERYFEPGKPTTISVQAANIGLSDETDLTLELLVNGVSATSKLIPFLSSGVTRTLSLDWTPQIEGTSALSVYLHPVEEESRTYNNWVNRTVVVFKPLGKVLIDASHSNNFQYTELLAKIEEEHFHHYTLENASELDSEGLEPYTIFATFQAQVAYSVEEISALETFVQTGGGLLVAGDSDADYYEPLTDYAGITWTDQMALFGTTNEIEVHPITTNVSELYFDSPNVVLDVNGEAQEVVRDETPLFPNLLVAAAPYDGGRVVAIVDSNALDDDHVNESDNLVFGLNILHWINNQIPVALIDTPSEGLYPVDESITFDAGSSYDPEGLELTFKWVSDREGEFGSQVNFNYTLSERGPHTITLSVSDGFKHANATVEIILNTPPEARILVPAPGSVAPPGSEVTFVAEPDADPDGDEVEYLWVSSLDGVLSRQGEFTLTNLSQGDHIITLTVTDPYGIANTSSITIYINTPPTASIDSPEGWQTYQTEELVFFKVGEAHDEDGDPLTYLWTSSIDGNISNGDEFWETLSAGEHEITLLVSDGYNNIENHITIYVNSPPTIILDIPEDNETYLTTDLIRFDASRSHDTDFDSFRFDWTSNIDGVLGRDASFVKRLSAGEHRIRLEVNDENGGVVWRELFIIVNTPPVARIDSPEGGKIYQVTEEIMFDATSSVDPEDELGFKWNSDLDGVIGNDQVFTGYLSPGQHTITLEVDDSRNGKDSKEVTIWVNTPPECIIDKPVDKGVYPTSDDVEFDASSCFDPEDELNYIWSSDVVGQIGYDKVFATELSAGKHVITLTVDDGRGGMDQMVIEIELDAPPEVVLLEPVYGQKISGKGATLSWRGTDMENDILTYDVYLDTVNPPGNIVSYGQTVEFLVLEELEIGKTYYWKVVANDGYAESESETRTFVVEEEEDNDGSDISMILLSASIGSLVLIPVSFTALSKHRRKRESQKYYDEWDDEFSEGWSGESYEDWDSDYSEDWD